MNEELLSAIDRVLAPPLSVQERSPHATKREELNELAQRRERLEATAMIYAAQCALLAAQIDSLAILFDVATSNSLHNVATEVRRADTSLKAIVRLSKTTTGEPR